MCVCETNPNRPSLQWNLTAPIRAITVTKTQAAAPIAAWMKLTLKRTLYGHLGVMQVNQIANIHVEFSLCVSFSLTDERWKNVSGYDDSQRGKEKNDLFFFMKCKKRKKIAFHSINIISHCMVIGHWKCENNMQNTVVFFPIRIATESCTCSRTCQWHFSLSWGFATSLQKHSHKARANARTLIDTDGWLRPYLPWLKIAESSIIFDFIYLLDSIRFNIQWLTYFIFTWIGRSVGKFLPFRICLIKCPCALCRRLPLLVKPGPIYLYHPNRTHYAIKIRSK